MRPAGAAAVAGAGFSGRRVLVARVSAGAGGVSVADPSGVPPVSGVFGGGGQAAGGGLGFFFFGVVALLALGGLVVPGLFWRLGMTAPPAVASPFLALLERPG